MDFISLENLSHRPWASGGIFCPAEVDTKTFFFKEKNYGKYSKFTADEVYDTVN